MKSRFTAPSRMSAWATARARAPSEPGRHWIKRSARSALAVRRGSTTTSFPPAAWASSMKRVWWMLVSAAFFPQSTMSRALARSQGAL